MMKRRRLTCPLCGTKVESVSSWLTGIVMLAGHGACPMSWRAPDCMGESFQYWSTGLAASSKAELKGLNRPGMSILVAGLAAFAGAYLGTLRSNSPTSTQKENEVP